jgi:hypothetical protein
LKPEKGSIHSQTTFLLIRGQGVALFSQEVAKGMTEASEEMKQANLDTNVILFSMWTEGLLRILLNMAKAM